MREENKKATETTEETTTQTTGKQKTDGPITSIYDLQEQGENTLMSRGGIREAKARPSNTAIKDPLGNGVCIEAVHWLF